MTLNISLSPQAEEKLKAKAASLGEPLDAFAARVLEAAVSTLAVHCSDRETISLLRSWNAEDATNDPKEIASRERDWEDFAASINIYHSSDRRVYP